MGSDPLEITGATVIARRPGDPAEAWRHDCFTVDGARKLADLWALLHPFYEYEAVVLPPEVEA